MRTNLYTIELAILAALFAICTIAFGAVEMPFMMVLCMVITLAFGVAAAVIWLDMTNI